MRIILITLIFCAQFITAAHAQKLNDWCDIKEGARVVQTLPGLCSKYLHMVKPGQTLEPNLTKDAEEQARFAEEATRHSKANQIKADLAQCIGTMKKPSVTLAEVKPCLLLLLKAELLPGLPTDEL